MGPNPKCLLTSEAIFHVLELLEVSIVNKSAGGSYKACTSTSIVLLEEAPAVPKAITVTA